MLLDKNFEAAATRFHCGFDVFFFSVAGSTSDLLTLSRVVPLV